MAEPIQTAVARARSESPGDPEEAPLDLADFPGCRAERISREEIGDYDGRVEYREARTETAVVVCEPTTRFHEQPSQRLAGLAQRIAASRGSPIETFGTTDLVRYDPQGERKVLMQADQILYLHPLEFTVWERDVDIDSRERPDVVLEVDYSTDVRRRKLRIYEAWGFPEVWVDVPDAPSPSRPKSRLSGLALHVLEGGKFRTASNSRAFPGWTAEEIHRALNEPATSEETLAALRGEYVHLRRAACGVRRAAFGGREARLPSAVRAGPWPSGCRLSSVAVPVGCGPAAVLPGGPLAKRRRPAPPTLRNEGGSHDRE